MENDEVGLDDLSPELKDARQLGINCTEHTIKGIAWFWKVGTVGQVPVETVLAV